MNAWLRFLLLIACFFMLQGSPTREFKRQKTSIRHPDLENQDRNAQIDTDAQVPVSDVTPAEFFDEDIADSFFGDSDDGANLMKNIFGDLEPPPESYFVNAVNTVNTVNDGVDPSAIESQEPSADFLLDFDVPHGSEGTSQYLSRATPDDTQSSSAIATLDHSKSKVDSLSPPFVSKEFEEWLEASTTPILKEEANTVEPMIFLAPSAFAFAPLNSAVDPLVQNHPRSHSVGGSPDHIGAEIKLNAKLHSMDNAKYSFNRIQRELSRCKIAEASTSSGIRLTGFPSSRCESQIIYMSSRFRIDSLEFKNVRFYDTHAPRLIRIISQTKIANFGLFSCNFEDALLARIVKVLFNFELASFAIIDTLLSLSAVTIIADGLVQPSCTLETLTLSNNGLACAGSKILGISLRDPLSKLKHLTLRHNRIDGQSLNILAHSISTPHSSLRTLNLEGNDLGPDEGPVLSSLLLHSMSRLETLEIGSNNLGDVGASFVFEALRHDMCKLKSLDISHNALTIECVDNLTRALTDPNTKLTALSFKGNSIGPQGVVLIALTFWSPHSKLQALDLSGVGIGLEGTASLSDALRHKHCNLKSLDIGFNGIDDFGALNLALALGNPHGKLENLRINNNFITEYGAVQLLSALPFSHVSTLELQHNLINLELIQFLLNSNQLFTLTHLNLEHNIPPNHHGPPPSNLIRAHLHQLQLPRLNFVA